MLSFGTTSVMPLRAPPRSRQLWKAAGGYEVELRSAAEAEVEIEAWRALARRAFEPSLFAEPELLLPALKHLPDGRQASLILVWQGTSAGRLLRGLLPVMLPRLPLVPGEVRLWRPGSFPVAPALLDRERPEAVLAAVLSFCGSRGSRCARLALPAVLADGALSGALPTAARRTGAADGFASGLLATGVGAGEPGPRASGPFRVASAGTAAQIRDAVEILLVLDAAGAKARHGSALIQDAGMASFLRTATRRLARRRRCRVELLHAGDEPVAAAILVETVDSFWLWCAATAGAAAADALVASVAARAHRHAKRLVIPASLAISAATSAALALAPLTLADLAVPIRPGLSPGAAVRRLRSRIDSGLRAAVRGGVQRLLRA